MIESHGQSPQIPHFGGDQIFDISKSIKEGNWNPNSRSTKSKSKEYRIKGRALFKECIDRFL